MFSQSFATNLIKRPQPRLVRPRNPLSPFIQNFFAQLYYRALLRTQYATQEELSIIQKTRLHAIVTSAQKYVPFYQEYLRNVHSLQHFTSLSPLSKERLRAEFDRGRLINQALASFQLPQHTSGSTGVPLHFYVDRNMTARRLALYRRLLNWLGRKPGDTVVRLVPEEFPGLEPEGLLLRCGGPDEVETMKDRLYALFRGASIILHSRTSHLIRLAQLLEADRERFQFRALISHAEPLLPETRGYLKRIYQAPVFDSYGSSEITTIGHECEAHEGFHINGEWVYVEILDEANKPAPPENPGDIVVTAFDNEVMPFIKYKLGDQGWWLPEPCPCGRTLPRIKMSGRDINAFLLPNGGVGNFFTLIKPIALLVQKIFQYQVIRHAKDRFVIQLVPRPGFGESDRVFILKRFSQYLGGDATITIELLDKIERPPHSKEQAFVNFAPDWGRVEAGPS